MQLDVEVSPPAFVLKPNSTVFDVVGYVHCTDNRQMDVR